MLNAQVDSSNAIVVKWKLYKESVDMAKRLANMQASRILYQFLLYGRRIKKTIRAMTQMSC